MKPSFRWVPTAAHTRAVLAGLIFSIAAVSLRRPDLLVVATPLIVAAVWGVALRPRVDLSVEQHLGRSSIREGDSTRWQVRMVNHHSRVDDVVALFDTPRWIEQNRANREVVVSLSDDGDESLSTVIRSTRWGDHRLDPALVVAASGLNAFRHVSRGWTDQGRLLTLPQPARFDAAAPAVRAPGLVGVHRSPRPGSGSDFESIRLFQPGDKLRRIHWPQSLRTGSLHVASTWADHDRHVVLLIDAFDDLGQSDGIDGRASSLDIALRAAAAIAEHFTTAGDRVALATMGASGLHRVRPGTGYRHLRQMLEVMARVRPANALFDDGRMPHGMGSGALIVMLSPLLSAGALYRLVAIGNAGFNTVAIDCLPPDIAAQNPSEPYDEISWRIEILKRETQLRRVGAAGIAVVPWQGPGSLDLVLRGLHRRPGVRTGRR